MVDDLRHWDLDDEIRDSVLACDVDLQRALDVDGLLPSRSVDERGDPSSPPPALDPDDDADPSIR